MASSNTRTKVISLFALLAVLTGLMACTPPPIVNRAPVAFAGYDLSVGLGETVNLNGSQSFDPDKNALHYHWWLRSPDGEFVPAGDEAFIQFSAQQLGTYVASLVVDDGDKKSAADLLSIKVLSAAESSDLKANAGSGMQMISGTSTQLNGQSSGANANDASLTFHWDIVDSPNDAVEDVNFSFTGRNSPTPTFTHISPSDTTVHELTSGVFVFSLRVANAQQISDPDFVSLAIGSDRSTAVVAKMQAAPHYSLDAEGNSSFNVVSELSNASVDSNTTMAWWLISGPEVPQDSEVICPKPGLNLANTQDPLFPSFPAEIDTSSGAVPLASLNIQTSCAGLWLIMLCPQGPRESCPQDNNGQIATNASCCKGLVDVIEIHIEEFSQ